MKLKTKRFILKDPTLNDVNDIVENLNNYNISKYLPAVKYPYTTSEGVLWINFCKKIKHEQPRTRYEFSVQLKFDKRVVGGISLKNINKQSAEVGYWLSEKYWGKHIMSEVLEKVIEFGFNKLKLKIINVSFDKGNVASYHLLQKFKFQQSNWKETDEETYSLLKKDWEKMKEIELYQIKDKKHQRFNYFFDKITSLFIKSEYNNIKNPKKILFLRNDHIGDMVHSTQIFREIKKIFPRTKISVLASSANKSIIEKNKNVDHIIEMDLFWRRKNIGSFLNYLKVLKKIKKERFDVGVDLRMSKLNVFFFLFIPKIRSRIGYYNVNGGKAFLTHPILYDKKVHVIKEPIKLINTSFGTDVVKDYFPEIITDKKDEQDVKELIKQKDIKKYIMIFPGATNESRKWREERFNQLIKIFHKKYPAYKIIIACGDDEGEIADRLCKENPFFTISLIGFGLRKLSLLLKDAKVIISNSTFGSLGWVVDGNLIMLSNGIDLEIHAPLKKTKIIHHKLKCYPCDWTKKCKKPCGVWCMDLINVKEVMNAVDKFIKQK